MTVPGIAKFIKCVIYQANINEVQGKEMYLICCVKDQLLKIRKNGYKTATDNAFYFTPESLNSLIVNRCSSNNATTINLDHLLVSCTVLPLCFPCPGQCVHGKGGFKDLQRTVHALLFVDALRNTNSLERPSIPP